MMIHFWENTFWAKTSLSLEFRGPNYLEGQTHFGLKHYFPLYLEGQMQCNLMFSGMPIGMVQVSKLYDDPFLRKYILG